MDISDRVVVLDYGRKIADGPPDEVRANPEVIAAYLGEQRAEAPHPSPLPASGESAGPIATAMGG
jgi:ABC-type hemin transport system ATPase subunit